MIVPRQIDYVQYRMALGGRDMEKVAKELGREWDFTVKKYGIESRIILRKPFSFWNMKRPSPSDWDTYFIRSPFHDPVEKQKLWLNVNKHMWGTVLDAYDVEHKFVDGEHFYEFKTEDSINANFVQEYLSKYDVEVLISERMDSSNYCRMFQYLDRQFTWWNVGIPRHLRLDEYLTLNIDSEG